MARLRSLLPTTPFYSTPQLRRRFCSSTSSTSSPQLRRGPHARRHVHWRARIL
jgi:hypothetical protein